MTKGRPVILEGIVTTLNSTGQLNVAPMGPDVRQGMQRFTLRPFQTSTTYQNLKAQGEGVLHITDDALLLARAAIGLPIETPQRPASRVKGRILTSACRYYEFRVTSLDDREPRATIQVETLADGRLRDFFGWNRAKHAVIEAAVLATRTEILPLESILRDFRPLATLVEKTGGDPEREAFGLLLEYVREQARSRGLEPDQVRQ